MARIRIVTPSPLGARAGNSVTARRWAERLGELGHSVRLVPAREDDGEPRRDDLLVALHARKSARSVARWKRYAPERPVVVALTGTDVYGALGHAAVQRSLDLADRVVVLQPLALDELPPAQRRKAHVVRQSARPPRSRPPRRSRTFDVCVLAGLRPVKDPLRAALASRLLPDSSRLRVLHAGPALSESLRARAERETERNPRYRWLGPLTPGRALRLLAASRALVLSSRREGGANAISEAVVCGVPVLASRIPGNVGLLGTRHPGYFEPGATSELAALLLRLETDSAFERRLRRAGRELASRFTPAHERAAWRAVLRGLELPRSLAHATRKAKLTGRLGRKLSGSP